MKNVGTLLSAPGSLVRPEQQYVTAPGAIVISIIFFANGDDAKLFYSWVILNIEYVFHIALLYGFKVCNYWKYSEYSIN